MAHDLAVREAGTAPSLQPARERPYRKGSVCLRWLQRRCKAEAWPIPSLSRATVDP